jgi:hypothetical protein
LEDLEKLNVSVKPALAWINIQPEEELEAGEALP